MPARDNFLASTKCKTFTPVKQQTSEKWDPKSTKQKKYIPVNSRFLPSAQSLSWPGGWSSCPLFPHLCCIWRSSLPPLKTLSWFSSNKNTAPYTKYSYDDCQFSLPILSEINFWNTNSESKTQHIFLSLRTFSAWSSPFTISVNTAMLCLN